MTVLFYFAEKRLERDFFQPLFNHGLSEYPSVRVSFRVFAHGNILWHRGFSIFFESSETNFAICNIHIALHVCLHYRFSRRVTYKQIIQPDIDSVVRFGRLDTAIDNRQTRDFTPPPFIGLFMLGHDASNKRKITHCCRSVDLEIRRHYYSNPTKHNNKFDSCLFIFFCSSVPQCMQGIGDIDPSVFALGGHNVTGFRIVDHMNSTVRKFLNDGWHAQTGRRRISVSAILDADYSACSESYSTENTTDELADSGSSQHSQNAVVLYYYKYVINETNRRE